MTWEGVPWMIDGAEHTAEVGRLLGYLATQAGEGIAAPADLKVVASAIPDGNVHILSGAGAAMNRFPGGGQQTYLFRNEGDEVVALAPQGSSGVRYDLVCVVVEDPQYPGMPEPVDPANGPYVKSKVYSNVPADTTHLWEVDPDQTGYALARVKFDASDGTVNPVDIVDLRKLVLARRDEFLRVVNGVGASQTPLPGPGSVVATPTTAETMVDIPDWATHMIVEADWAGIQALDMSDGNGRAIGFVRVLFPDMDDLSTQYVEWAVDAVGPGYLQVFATFCGGELEIADEFKGTRQNVRPILYRDSQAAMQTSTDRYTNQRLRITFMERVV